MSVLPKAAIPSVDGPIFGEEYLGDSDDEVLVVEPDGETSPAHAYPVRI
ncbi:hypothetical protein [Halorubrum sp. Boch-26]|nr:hypothetical protein [Halorubrum sp. Boch-26]